MDWFERWPKEALVAVSNHFLANYEIICSPQVKQAIVQTMGDFQVRIAVVAASTVFGDVLLSCFAAFLNNFVFTTGQEQQTVSVL